MMWTVIGERSTREPALWMYVPGNTSFEAAARAASCLTAVERVERIEVFPGRVVIGERRSTCPVVYAVREEGAR